MKKLFERGTQRMKKLFKKIINAKAPIKLVGNSLVELGLLTLIVASGLSLLASAWGASSTLFIWLLIISIYVFLQAKKNSMIWDRLDEIDQRDMDFKDEFDCKVTRFLDSRK